MRACFDRIVAGKKDRRKIALVAVAHKLVRCMLAMLRTGETWRTTAARNDHAPTNQEAQPDKQAALETPQPHAA